jgi:hypothetical protein
MTNGDKGSSSGLEDFVSDFDARKEKLIGALKRLCVTYHYEVQGRSLLPSAAKILLSYNCERKARFYIKNPGANVEPHFDPYYGEKSRFATTYILDHLKRRLSEDGIEYTMTTERRSDLGVYDAVVGLKPQNVGPPGNQAAVRLEVKAGAGIALEQVARYLISDSTPLVLARVAFNHVAVLRNEDLQLFGGMLIDSLVAKANRVAEGKHVTIPGRDCFDCADSTCEYYRGWHKRRETIVSLGAFEFQRDLDSFFENLSSVAEMASYVVLDELNAPVRTS